MNYIITEDELTSLEKTGNPSYRKSVEYVIGRIRSRPVMPDLEDAITKQINYTRRPIMTDYIFTGETLYGKIVEGDLVTSPNGIITYIIQKEQDDAISLKNVQYEVRPESVRLKSVPLRVAVERIFAELPCKGCTFETSCRRKSECELITDVCDSVENPTVLDGEKEGE